MRLKCRFSEGSKLTVIEEGAFAVSGLKMMFIPKSVEKIGGCAFANTKELKEVRFEEGSGLKEVGKLAFYLSGIQGKIEFPPGAQVMEKDVSGVVDRN